MLVLTLKGSGQVNHNCPFLSPCNLKCLLTDFGSAYKRFSERFNMGIIWFIVWCQIYVGVKMNAKKISYFRIDFEFDIKTPVVKNIYSLFSVPRKLSSRYKLVVSRYIFKYNKDEHSNQLLNFCSIQTSHWHVELLIISFFILCDYGDMLFGYVTHNFLQPMALLNNCNNNIDGQKCVCNLL